MRSLIKPASLSSRITLLLVLVSLLVLGGGSKWMDWRIDHAMESRFEQNLLAQAMTLRSVIQVEEQASTGNRVLTHTGMLSGSDPTYYEVSCPGVPPLRSSPPLPIRPTGWSRDVPTHPRFKSLQHGAANLAFVQFSYADTPGRTRDDASMRATATSAARLGKQRTCVLLFAQDRSAMEDLLGAIDWILLIGPVLAALIALVAVPLIVRRGLRPMAALIERMREIGPNAPGERLASVGVRELDPLVARFNDVLERMDDGLASERQFASGLAHETRTRLAELRALAEVEVRYPSGRSMPDVLSEVGSIGAELEATVTALLLLTRLQSRIEPPQWQFVALGPWLAHQRQRMQGIASARRVELRCESSAQISLRTDPALLEIVIGNLLANACTYAPSGDLISLQLTGNSVRIDNAAPELVAADLVNFGQRFWRKQWPHAAHAGLGLALACAAAQVLNLNLDFQLDSNQRLRATVSWLADMGRATDSCASTLS